MESPIPTTCADSVSRNSYIGCDYWPTVTINPVWPQFDFAVAVSNPQYQDVTVTVTGGGLSATETVTVPARPGAGDHPAVGAGAQGADVRPEHGRVRPGAEPHRRRRRVSPDHDLPVSVYQFSALEYEIDAGTLRPDGGTCPGEGDGGAGPHCFSYSNDASLLLPTNVASGDYGILAWPSFAATPGFLAVVATHREHERDRVPLGPRAGRAGTGPGVHGARGQLHVHARRTRATSSRCSRTRATSTRPSTRRTSRGRSSRPTSRSSRTAGTAARSSRRTRRPATTSSRRCSPSSRSGRTTS